MQLVQDLLKLIAVVLVNSLQNVPAEKLFAAIATKSVIYEHHNDSSAKNADMIVRLMRQQIKADMIERLTRQQIKADMIVRLTRQQIKAFMSGTLPRC